MPDKKEVTFCNPLEAGANLRLHKWVYLMSSKTYKCQECGVKVLKSELKELTDNG